jgi:sensor histidine kinase YesM
MKVRKKGIKNFKIKTKLILFCLIIVVLVSSIFVFINRNSQKNLVTFMSNQDTYYAINSLNMNLRKTKTILAEYIKESKFVDLMNFYEIKETNEVLLKKLKENSSSNEEKLLARALDNLCTVYYNNCLTVISLHVTQNSSSYSQFYYGDIILNYIYQYTSQYLQEKLSNDNSIYNVLKTRIVNIEKISYTLLVIIIAACIVFIFIFSNYIANPINQLIAMSSDMANGDLNVRKLDIKYYNEVGMLINSFNHMSASIRKLVSDLENKHEVEELLKEARFQALQAQINPHFLFNTLNIISRSVSFESADVTQKLIISLAQLFRYTLEHNEKNSTIEVEIEVVKKYLYIQKFRFNDRLSVSLNIDPLCKDNLIPKLTLQPLVENAFMHGLESSDKQGHIHIQTKKRGKNIIIRVFDNGIGINKERINEIMDPKSKIHTGTSTSVGILNIVNRIKFFNNGNLSIISKPEEWTIVKIIIPCERPICIPS